MKKKEPEYKHCAYALDREAALIILSYYASLARECEWGIKEVFRLNEEQVNILSDYLVTTITTELRFTSINTLKEYAPGRNYAIDVLKAVVGFNIGGGCMSTIMAHDIYRDKDEQKYLRSAFCVFLEYPWSEGFGGPAWAHCSWRAATLLSALRNRNGYAERLLWETCLNACHNNNRWLSKLGECLVHKVLCFGAKATPRQILDLHYSKDPAYHIAGLEYGVEKNMTWAKLPSLDEVWGCVYG